VYDTRRTCMWCLLLFGFILLSPISEILMESEDEVRRLDQMESDGCKVILFLRQSGDWQPR
jgi:hypothetical protein